MLNFCIIIASLLIIGCYPASPSFLGHNQNPLENSTAAILANPFSIRVNQTAYIESENLELTLLEVKNESRCPTGTQCFWPGLVEVVIKIQQQEQVEELMLIAREDNESLATKTFNDYLIKLIEVEPYPQNNQAIAIEDYSASFLVSPQ